MSIEPDSTTIECDQEGLHIFLKNGKHLKEISIDKDTFQTKMLKWLLALEVLSLCDYERKIVWLYKKPNVRSSKLKFIGGYSM